MTTVDPENRANNRYPPNYYKPSYIIDSNEATWTPWLVRAIMVANVVMFIAIMYVNNCPKNNLRFGGKYCVPRFLGKFSFEPFKENPLLGPSSITLQKLGALNYEKAVKDHQGWRLISCIWLHASISHLLANMLSLFLIAIRLERQFGFIRVGAIYLLTGIGGSILSMFFPQRHISVGASGALFGLLGAMLSEFFTNWTIYTNKAPAFFTLVIFIFINLALGILPHVDNFAHIGGFVSGFLLGFVLLIRPQYNWAERRNLPADAGVKYKYMGYQYAFWVVALVLLVLGGIGSFVQRDERSLSTAAGAIASIACLLRGETAATEYI